LGETARGEDVSGAAKCHFSFVKTGRNVRRRKGLKGRSKDTGPGLSDAKVKKGGYHLFILLKASAPAQLVGNRLGGKRINSYEQSAWRMRGIAKRRV